MASTGLSRSPFMIGYKLPMTPNTKQLTTIRRKTPRSTSRAKPKARRRNGLDS